MVCRLSERHNRICAYKEDRDNILNFAKCFDFFNGFSIVPRLITVNGLKFQTLAACQNVQTKRTWPAQTVSYQGIHCLFFVMYFVNSIHVTSIYLRTENFIGCGGGPLQRFLLIFFRHEQKPVWTSLEKQLDPLWVQLLLDGFRTSICKRLYSNMWFSRGCLDPLPPLDPHMRRVFEILE